MVIHFKKSGACVLVCLLLLLQNNKAQNLHAVQGSSFAGSLGIANNPASIVNTPNTWDLTVFSLQSKWSTNAVKIYNYSLLSSATKSKYLISSGNFKRFADYNYNLHLLNFRIALDRKQSIAFGFNLRGYGNAGAGTYRFLDTVHDTRQFFALSDGAANYNGKFTGSNWAEIFATYSKTLWEDETGRLNGGITVKVMRGLAGAYARAGNGTVNKTITADSFYYTLNSASVEYAYSRNFDSWQKGTSTAQNLNQFIRNSRGGFAMDLGLEYLVKPPGVETYNEEEDSYYDYDWKIGLSILDIGYNQFISGAQSRIATAVLPVSDTALDQKFSNIGSAAEFNDSATSLFKNFSSLEGRRFTIANPARLVINIDKPLPNNFYVNGELSINLSPSSNKLQVQEINLLSITPRWETEKWGVYMPVLYNTNNQFWIGGAFKIGPLLLGVHNWGNVFSKTKMANGGGYLALVLRAKKHSGKKVDKRLDCPSY